MYKLKEGNIIKRVYKKNKTIAEIEYLKNNIKLKEVKRKILKYNLEKQGNKKCKGNEGSIKKNEKHMTNEEKIYLKSKVKNINIDNMIITPHAIGKQLINLKDVKCIIKNKQYKIVDFNYFPHNHEERILIRSKKKYQIENTKNGKTEESYIKVVISLKTFAIISIWSNKCKDEPMKNKYLGERYIEKFDIINKKVKLN